MTDLSIYKLIYQSLSCLFTAYKVKKGTLGDIFLVCLEIFYFFLPFSIH